CRNPDYYRKVGPKEFLTQVGCTNEKYDVPRTDFRVHRLPLRGLAKHGRSAWERFVSGQEGRCLLLALRGHRVAAGGCPLVALKGLRPMAMSGNDPKSTWQCRCEAQSCFRRGKDAHSPFIDAHFDRLLNYEVFQAPARLGSRQTLSKGRRQAWGAMS